MVRIIPAIRLAIDQKMGHSPVPVWANWAVAPLLIAWMPEPIAFSTGECTAGAP